METVVLEAFLSAELSPFLCQTGTFWQTVDPFHAKTMLFNQNLSLLLLSIISSVDKNAPYNLL
jgi:hypothetical protein